MIKCPVQSVDPATPILRAVRPGERKDLLQIPILGSRALEWGRQSWTSACSPQTRECGNDHGRDEAPHWNSRTLTLVLESELRLRIRGEGGLLTSPQGTIRQELLCEGKLDESLSPMAALQVTLSCLILKCRLSKRLLTNDP